MKTIKYLFIFLIILLFGQTRDQLGDVNNDGSVDVVDIVLAVDIILTDGVNYGDYELWAGDVNADLEVNVQDIVVIVNVVLGSQCEEFLYHPCTDDLSQCCMDTSAYNFGWAIDTLGIAGSFLLDVSVGQGTNVWAVGEIKLSTDINDRYNLAHFDGSGWNLHRVTAEPNNLYSYFNCIRVLNENDIWVGADKPLHWNGETWSLYLTPVYPASMGWMNAIWGIDSSDMYFVHDDGNIVHRNGTSFDAQYTGTTINLRRIHGDSSGQYVFAVGWENSGESIVLMKNAGEWNQIYHSTNYYPNGDYGRISAVQVIGSRAYFGTQAGIWEYFFLADSSNLIPSYQCQLIGRNPVEVSGTVLNDIIVSTGSFELVHFNGESWSLDDSVYHYFNEGDALLKASDYFINNFASIGVLSTGGQALVLRGINVNERGVVE